MNIMDRFRQHIRQIEAMILVCCDAGVVFLAIQVAAFLFLGEISGKWILNKQTYLLFLGITLSSFYIFDLYYTAKDFRRYRQLVNLILATASSAAFFWLFVPWGGGFFGKRWLFVYSLILFLITLAGRFIFSILRKKVFYKNAIIIGDSGIANVVAGLLVGKGRTGENYGLNLVGYLADTIDENKKSLKSFSRLGTLKDLEKVLEAYDVSLLIYALEEAGDSRLNEAIVREKIKGRELISAVALYEGILGKEPYEYMPAAWLIEECLRGNKFAKVRVKRIGDILLGLFFLIIFSPVMICCMIMITLESKGGALFEQERVGQFGKLFKMYKLRTMAGKIVRGAHEDKWGDLYRANKGRETRVGAFLRKFHIDEIPQFFNVVKGDMSIVGPRPEMELFIKKCERRIPFYRLRLAVKPGITGWAQVWHGHTSTLAGYKEKFKYDLFYLASTSLRLDLEIMIRTSFRILGYPKL